MSLSSNWDPTANSGAGASYTATPTTSYEYNAYGELVKENVLVSQAAGGAQTWASTWHWYDGLGRESATVDAGKYLTSKTYTAFGEVETVTEHARSLTATLSTATAPTAPPIGDATVGFNRTVEYGYDELGRQSTTTRMRRYQDLAGSTLYKAVVEKTEYDAEGHVTRVTKDGVATEMQYDALGRLKLVIDPSRLVLKSDNTATAMSKGLNDASLYTMAHVVTRVLTDALGNTVSSQRIIVDTTNVLPTLPPPSGAPNPNYLAPITGSTVDCVFHSCRPPISPDAGPAVLACRATGGRCATG